MVCSEYDFSQPCSSVAAIGSRTYEKRRGEAKGREGKGGGEVGLCVIALTMFASEPGSSDPSYVRADQASLLRPDVALPEI
jgi:hypothetical protein